MHSLCECDIKIGRSILIYFDCSQRLSAVFHEDQFLFHVRMKWQLPDYPVLFVYI